MGAVNNAVQALTKAIEKGNTNQDLYELCWRILFQAENYTEARRILELGFEYCGRTPILLAQMGGLETRLGNFTVGLSLLEEALNLDQNNSLVWINYGNLNEAIGRVDEAVACFRKALSIDGENTIAISNLLLSLNYLPIPKKSLYQAHQLYMAPVKPFSLRMNTEPTSQGNIRIGYLSSDFRFHAVAFFLLPLLANHNREQFDIYCYADNSSQDEVTSLFKTQSTQWRDINALSDEKVAEIIQADGIRILVDLTGHSLGRRLRLLKSRPAPLQVSYLGYPNTSGSEEMDYRIVDAITDPPDEDDQYFHEKLVRVEPPFIRYCPLGPLPEICALPALKNGFVTFGSFNRLAKISDHAVKAWSQILAAIPGAKLLLKTRALEEPVVKLETLRRFQQHGIDEDQIIIEGWSKSHYDYLTRMGQVDIALDTWPYNGTTTTCNALVMGVPVLTLRGDRHGARVSSSILESLSLAECIARDEDEIVKIAIGLTQNLDRLMKLRLSLRQTVLHSRLADGKQLVTELEAIYQSLIVT